MIYFHPVILDRELDRTNPLYVGHFFNLKGMWWCKRKQRQGLIISIALAWYRLVKNYPGGEGFIERETLITNLTRQVKDAKVILDHFFIVKKLGYNIGGSKSPTIITPRRLSKKYRSAVEAIINEVVFNPGPAPTGNRYTMSEVHVKPNSEIVLHELRQAGREDLIAPVKWLLEQPCPITFFFERAGSLQARDKSVWPIRSIELWPGWLRQALFGTVVDIENSYVQFLVQRLKLKYANNPNQMKLKYPDLLRADGEKHKFRLELRELLDLPNSKDGLDVVKKLIMALANGSNASPALMTNGSGRSEAVKLIYEAKPELTTEHALLIGKRLQPIARQFSAAKRDLCLFMGKKPTRKNQREIYREYFLWEREARYKIWEASGKTGLMLHDGIDGVRSDLSQEDLSALIQKSAGIKVSVSA